MSVLDRRSPAWHPDFPIPDRTVDGAIAVLREQWVDDADGESAHVVCDAVLQLRAKVAGLEADLKAAKVAHHEVACPRCAVMESRIASFETDLRLLHVKSNE